MINIFRNVRSFKYLLFALLVLSVESKAFCQGYPCAYLQPPWPLKQFMHFTKPSYYQYPPVYYYQYTGHGFQVPTVGSLSPSNYPFQRPPLPIVIFVTKLPDQSSGSNQQAVQALTPTVSSSSAAPTTAIKPADTSPLESAGTTQTSIPILSTPQSITPTSTPPLSPIASPQSSSSPPVNSTLSPTPSTKPSAPTTLPNYKPMDTKTSNNQRSLESISWEDKWQQTVYTSTGTKLCQTNNPRGIFTEQDNDNCNNACQESFDNKVKRIGLTETGVMSLGGSCHRQFQTKRDFCLCNLKLGRESGQFLLINEERNNAA